MANKRKVDAGDFQSIINKIKGDLGALGQDNDDEIKELRCRVCGFEYDQANAPWRRLDGEWYPLYEICVCCNVQFGYEDIDEGSVKSYREKWISSGGDFHYKALKPSDWSREEQLKKVPEQWRS